jgi:hypothetical protein
VFTDIQLVLELVYWMDGEKFRSKFKLLALCPKQSKQTMSCPNRNLTLIFSWRSTSLQRGKFGNKEMVTSLRGNQSVSTFGKEVSRRNA